MFKLNDKMLEHYNNPKNKGVMKDYDVIGMSLNSNCEDEMYMFLKIDNNIIKDVKFETLGCGSAVATASLMTEMIKGKDLQYAFNLTSADVRSEMGGFKTFKTICSSLAERSLKAAIKKYALKNNIEVIGIDEFISDENNE